jgi:hypothetical protein
MWHTLFTPDFSESERNQRRNQLLDLCGLSMFVKQWFGEAAQGGGSFENKPERTLYPAEGTRRLGAHLFFFFSRTKFCGTVT